MLIIFLVKFLPIKDINWSKPFEIQRVIIRVLCVSIIPLITRKTLVLFLVEFRRIGSRSKTLYIRRFNKPNTY